MASLRQVERYHPVFVAVHWLLAFLIIADLTIGTFVLVHIPNDVPQKVEALRMHMSVGLVILVLMVVRLGLRIGTAAPAEARAGHAFLDRLALLSHRTLYVAVFGMALSGLVMGLQAQVPQVVFLGEGKLPASFWDYSLRSVHYFFARLLIAVIALHIVGALYHVIIRRDGLLRRMWFGRRGLGARAAAAPETDLSAFWRYAHRVARFFLVVPAALFIVIGWKYLSGPVQIAAGSQITLGSPAAVTDMRAEGALFLALAALLSFSLASSRRVLAGLVLLATVIVFVTASRILGIIVDGAAPESIFKLVPEIVLLVLSILGLLVERGRRRRLRGQDEALVGSRAFAGNMRSAT